MDRFLKIGRVELDWFVGIMEAMKVQIDKEFRVIASGFVLVDSEHNDRFEIRRWIFQSSLRASFEK